MSKSSALLSLIYHNLRLNEVRPLGLKALLYETLDGRQAVYLAIIAGISVFSPIKPVIAQSIQADNTLSINGFTDSVVNQIGNDYTINGGTAIGTNLFHSFLQFSVPNSGSAVFNNAATIQNIISRVTGTNISDIQGLIQANGIANFFLINPNGIIFGANATLDVGGAFVASTADSLVFLGGGQFSATNPNAAGTLLTMNAPLGLQMGANPAEIRVQGLGNNLVTDPRNFEIIRLPSPPFRPINPLTVNVGQTLALVGGNIAFEGGNIEISDGRVELASLSNGQVDFINQNGQLQLAPLSDAVNYQNITLTNASSISVSGNNGGSIQVQGRNLTLSNGSVMLANTRGSGQGGNIDIRTTDSIKVTGVAEKPPFVEPRGIGYEIFSSIFADVSSSSTAEAQGGNLSLETRQLIVSDGGQMGANTFGDGKAGKFTVNADQIQLIGESFLGPSGLFAVVTPNAAGQGGILTITTNDLQMSEGAQILGSTFGSGNGGRININAQTINIEGNPVNGNPTAIFTGVEIDATGQGGDLTIQSEQIQLRDGGQIGIQTFGSGDAGILAIQANEIIIQGISEFRPSGIGSQVGRLSVPNDPTEGNGGQININTNQLTLQDGGIVSTNTAGVGSAGEITVNANTIEVRGGVKQTASGLFSAVTPTARGNGGQMTLNTNTLRVQEGGQIAASTAGVGNGGSLEINAQSVILSGRSDLGPSGLFANAILGTGEGGNINLNSDQLTLENGATINVGNFSSSQPDIPPGEGTPGNLIIQSNSMTLTNQSTITADTVTGTDGNLTIDANSVNLQDNSQISTNAFGAGSGGNINLNSQTLKISDRSGLSANAEGNGNGGNIAISNTDNLTLENNSFLSTNAQGIGQGGNINILTGNLQILDNSVITANASATSGGNIDINVASGGELLLDSSQITATGGQGNISVNAPITFLRNNSLISTNGTGTEPGGNITITTDFLLAVPTENSDITANAQQSLGGRVTINALGIFGIEFRQSLTPLSDITVTSELGPDFSGEVSILIPEGDPTSGFTRLPENTIDASDLITVACPADEGNIFIQTGKGGIPDNPSQPLQWRMIWQDLRDFEIPKPNSPTPSPESGDRSETLINCVD